MYCSQQGFALRNSLITIAIIIALLAVIITQLPKGYSDDVSKIGKGSNVALLLHDKNSVTSLDMMGFMDDIRYDYEGKVDFMVVNMSVSTPMERAFVQQQELNHAALILFSPDGMRLNAFASIQDSGGLRKALDETFHLKQ